MGTSRRRGRQLALTLHVLRLIRRRPMTRYDLAAALGVHPRTILRTLHAIEDAGIVLTRGDRPSLGCGGPAVVYRWRGRL